MMLLLLAFACMVSGSFAAISADLRPYNITSALMFVANDKNEDLILQKAEFDNLFKVYDYNKDNIIERHEYVCMITASNANLAYVSHAIYDDYDIDGDHRLDQHDFDGFYKKMDTDENGEVSYYEFVAYWTALLQATEHYSLHGNPHPQHTDKYCASHGHH